MLTFELNDGTTMTLEEEEGVLKVSLYDTDGFVSGCINWEAESVCDMLLCDIEG